MSQSAKDAFKAEPQSTGEFFTRTGEYFYVPVYQRPYSWRTNDDVRRLFVDATEGVSDLLSRRSVDALMFIGALILVEDRKKEQIVPIVRDQVPAKVNIVIDGQQRCTTLLIWACALLERISIGIKALERRSGEPGFANLVDMANRTAGLLELMVRDDERGSDPAFSHYPRMIRSHEDQWSKRSGEAQYVSPLARILRHTSEWIRNGKDGKVGYSIEDVPEPAKSDHEPVFKAWQYFAKRCAEFADGGEYEDIAPPSPADMARFSHFQEALWGNPWHESVTSLIGQRGSNSEKDYRNAVGLARVVALANFILNKICFTVVRSDREGWAFDVFDALNTTGQPLTAFETFRPVVIQNIGLTNYRQSEEFRLLERIHEFLTSSSDKKTKRTEKLIIHAKLLELGEKLPKRLAVQRQWLKSHYQQLEGAQRRREFLEGLADLAEFTDVFNNPRQHLQLCRDQETLLALLYLSDTNHDIVIPVLSRFYSAAKSRKDDEAKERALADFRAVIRATTAFSTLWRLAHGGTEKIDDCFRAIMRGQQLSDGSRVGPFCTEPSPEAGESRPLTAASYITDLRAWLRVAELDSEDDWVRETLLRPSYNESPQFARLFLAAAMHNAIPDPARPGFLKRGNEGTCTMLSADAPWAVEEFQIEHVAPQSGKGNGWEDSIYREASLIHSLGNLTLLPASVNKAIKNWAWCRKRAVMELLATSSEDEAAKRRRELTEIGTLSEFPTLGEIVSNAQYHGHLRAVCGVATWDEDAIRSRGENLCRLGYQQLSRWLPVQA
jgi:hypothetical protein